MQKQHLVTGSSGYLGKKIVEKLISRGESVIGIDIRPESKKLQGIDFHQGDIRDEELVKRLMRGIDVVHHTAALVPLTRNYQEFKSVNELGSEILAKIAKKNGVKYFIHTSSSAVFGRTTDQAIDSNTPLRPIEPYGLSKLNGELAVKKELNSSRTKLAIIRPRTILGTERGGIFDLFFHWVKTNQPIFTIGNGNQKFQFIGSEDLIEAMFTILDSGAEGEFNVGTDQFGTLNEAFANLISFAGSRSKIRHLPVTTSIVALATLEKIGLSPLAPWHYRTFHKPFFFDVDPLLKLGWKPKFSNNDLFENSYKSYLNWSQLAQRHDLSPHSSKLDPKVLGFIQKFFR